MPTKENSIPRENPSRRQTDKRDPVNKGIKEMTDNPTERLPMKLKNGILGRFYSPRTLAGCASLTRFLTNVRAI